MEDARRAILRLTDPLNAKDLSLRGQPAAQLLGVIDGSFQQFGLIAALMADRAPSIIVTSIRQAQFEVSVSLNCQPGASGCFRRAATPEADAAAAEKLRTDPKEIAEHVMLVDLCRNDLGRIAAPGSLAVTELLATEGYSHVFHLVSTVTAALAAGLDEYDAIAASFPAGTMSGAPKVRAMALIEAIETSRRGLYAGALGLIDFSGYVDTGLAIRSALYDGTRFMLRASAGIVADSDPAAEWRATLARG